ncbi:MAG: hypothetical protein Barrevirus24_3 [Barrevirus sp.]|uniref:Uncharacterized protein n=1 Tax=Barrevirus sp. TaxID=2487763 RepID=A0A3G4ZUH7_9VIRU|nr:MAG: hypothetical protein Barrevirus24_3 [Barrevirus sp.]
METSYFSNPALKDVIPLILTKLDPQSLSRISRCNILLNKAAKNLLICGQIFNYITNDEACLDHYTTLSINQGWYSWFNYYFTKLWSRKIKYNNEPSGMWWGIRRYVDIMTLIGQYDYLTDSNYNSTRTERIEIKNLQLKQSYESVINEEKQDFRMIRLALSVINDNISYKNQNNKYVLALFYGSCLSENDALMKVDIFLSIIKNGLSLDDQLNTPGSSTLFQALSNALTVGNIEVYKKLLSLIDSTVPSRSPYFLNASCQNKTKNIEALFDEMMIILPGDNSRKVDLIHCLTMSVWNSNHVLIKYIVKLLVNEKLFTDLECYTVIAEESNCKNKLDLFAEYTNKIYELVGALDHNCYMSDALYSNSLTIVPYIMQNEHIFSKNKNWKRYHRIISRNGFGVDHDDEELARIEWLALEEGEE